jgi:cyclohexa-1,5-dienecarbonyl-CoA hydratase
MGNLILCEKDGHLARVIINRPPVNVLNIAAMEEMTDVLQEVNQDPHVRAVIITGAGTKAFSGGVDVADHTSDKMQQMLDSFGALIKTILKLDKVSIAAINGFALGGGCEVVIACDIAVSKQSAVLGQPEVKIGVYASIANVLLPRMIGHKNAMEFLLSGDSVTAAEAARIGLVNSVVPDDQWEAEVEKMAARLTDKSAAVLKWTRRSIIDTISLPWEEALKVSDQIYLSELMKTRDAAEGVDAFINKRKWTWQDK